MQFTEMIKDGHLIDAFCGAKDDQHITLYPSCRKKRDRDVLVFDVSITGKSDNYRGFTPDEFLALIRNPLPDQRATVRVSALDQRRFGNGYKIANLKYTDRLVNLMRGDDGWAIVSAINFDEQVEVLQEEELDLLIRKAENNGLGKKVIVASRTEYVRSPVVAAIALKKADGICDSCRQNAPFIKKSNGMPYLEVHHVEPLADGGLDELDNVIAICPNCHRKAHYG